MAKVPPHHSRARKLVWCVNLRRFHLESANGEAGVSHYGLTRTFRVMFDLPRFDSC